MPTYMESEIPTIVSTGNNGGGFGNGFSDGWWGIILIALLFGWGRNGYGGGFGGGYSGGSGEGSFGFQLGKLATQEDVASGFNNSAVLGSLNDLKLGQSSGFAAVQQTLCQGFNGINTSLLQGFHGVDNSVCTLGYNMASGFNSIGHQISDCCCKTQGAIADLKYANERQTCELITNANANTQRILDYMQAEKINSLTAENVALKGQISNNAQSRYIVDTVLDRLSPCPKPAYLTPNPNCCYNYGFNGGCTGIQ